MGTAAPFIRRTTHRVSRAGGFASERIQRNNGQDID